MRQAYGVPPACRRSRETLRGLKAGASSPHSMRFARFGCGFAALARAVTLSPAFIERSPAQPPFLWVFLPLRPPPGFRLRGSFGLGLRIGLGFGFSFGLL